MVKRIDYISAWFNQLKREDQINQALLDLSRNESRMGYLYRRDIRLTPPLMSVSNNAPTIHQLNALIKDSIHTIIDEQRYFDHLNENVPYSDIQQVVLGEHISSEKRKLAQWISLLNALVIYTFDVRKSQEKEEYAYVTTSE